MLYVYYATLVPLLLLAGLAVATAGPSRVLNLVDYGRVADPAALHRWVGTRLLGLAGLVAIHGLASLAAPGLAAPLAAASLLVLLAGIGWIAAGSARFQRRA